MQIHANLIGGRNISGNLEGRGTKNPCRSVTVPNFMLSIIRKMYMIGFVQNKLIC
jgi:hypothetical protein